MHTTAQNAIEGPQLQKYILVGADEKESIPSLKKAGNELQEKKEQAEERGEETLLSQSRSAAVGTIPLLLLLPPPTSRRRRTNPCPKIHRIFLGGGGGGIEEEGNGHFWPPPPAGLENTLSKTGLRQTTSKEKEMGRSCEADWKRKKERGKMGWEALFESAMDGAHCARPEKLVPHPSIHPFSVLWFLRSFPIL